MILESTTVKYINSVRLNGQFYCLTINVWGIPRDHPLAVVGGNDENGHIVSVRQQVSGEKITRAPDEVQ